MKDDEELMFDKNKYLHYSTDDDNDTEFAADDDFQNDDDYALSDESDEFQADAEDDIGSNIISDEYLVDDFETNDQSPDIDESSNMTEDKKKMSKKKIVIIIISVILAVIICLAGALAIRINSVINGINTDTEARTNIAISEDMIVKIPDVYNILCIGQDDLEETDIDYSRSDTMILVSLDKINSSVKLTSFMRDSYIEIPEHGYDRLNEAIKVGGPHSLMDTLECRFGIKIDAYAMVDFHTFVDVIDKLDGIEVDVTQKEANFIANIAPHIKAGQDIHMNGDEALLYARIRHVDSDFNRTGRQRKIINALIEKAKSTNITTLLSLANELAPDIKTSIDAKTIRKLIVDAPQYMSFNVEEMRIPIDGGYTDERVVINGKNADILKVDIGKNKKALNDFIYPQKADDKPVSASSVTTVAKAASITQEATQN